MANAQEIKNGMLSAESGVQEVLRALYFYGADYIMLKMGRQEKLVHKEQMILLMELGHETTTIDEISVMTLPEPASAKTRIEDVPPDNSLLVFSRKGGGLAGTLSKMSFEEYRERKIKESRVSYPEWWAAPLPLLYMDSERIAMNDAAGAKIPCEAKELAAQAEKIKRDGMITVKDKKRELTFSLHLLDENVYLVEDISGDFEMAEELVWWAAVGKAFVRRVEENGAVVRHLSPLETPPSSAAEVLYCSWENEPLGSIAIGMPGDFDQDENPPDDANHEEKEGGGGASDENIETEPDASLEPEKAEAPAQTQEPETALIPEESGNHTPEPRTQPAMKEKRKLSSLWEPKDDSNLNLDTMSEWPQPDDEPAAEEPEAAASNVRHESFGPFDKPAAKRKIFGHAAHKAEGRSHDEENDEMEPDLSSAIDWADMDDAGDDVKIEESAEKTAASKVLDKNAARRAYGGPPRRKIRGGGRNS
ncbi:MAG: hypothetical protein LBU13_00145 [Synergistaceae bacterium]|jgi:hypothetical protein|nr:hypothetical protein [Synergistaceae bacterium]